MFIHVLGLELECCFLYGNCDRRLTFKLDHWWFENGPRMLIYFNVWSPLGGTIRKYGLVGGGALLDRF